jgi:hypothetical protein
LALQEDNHKRTARQPNGDAEGVDGGLAEATTRGFLAFAPQEYSVALLGMTGLKEDVWV